MATAATIAMTCLGPEGLATAARPSHLRAEETKAALLALPGWSLAYTGPTFDEFVVRTPRAAQGIVDDVAARGVAAGITIGPHELLVCATEMTSSEDIVALVDAIRAAG